MKFLFSIFLIFASPFALFAAVVVDASASYGDGSTSVSYHALPSSAGLPKAYSAIAAFDSGGNLESFQFSWDYTGTYAWGIPSNGLYTKQPGNGPIAVQGQAIYLYSGTDKNFTPASNVGGNSGQTGSIDLGSFHYNKVFLVSGTLNYDHTQSNNGSLSNCVYTIIYDALNGTLGYNPATAIQPNTATATTTSTTTTTGTSTTSATNGTTSTSGSTSTTNGTTSTTGSGGSGGSSTGTYSGTTANGSTTGTTTTSAGTGTNASTSVTTSSTVVDFTPVDSRLDVANSHLTQLQSDSKTNTQNLQEMHDIQTAANLPAMDPAQASDNAAATGSATGARFGSAWTSGPGTSGVSDGISPGGAGDSPGVVSTDSGHGVVICGITYDFDPVHWIQNNGFMTFALACRALIAVIIVTGAYKTTLGIIMPLIGGLFGADSSNDTIRGNAGVSIIVAKGEVFASPVRPFQSAVRVALFLTFAAAVVAAIDTMCGNSLYSATTAFATSGVLSNAYNSFIGLGGRGMYFINLFIPVMTVIYMPLHIAWTTSAIIGAYLISKSTSAATQCL